MSGVVDRLAQSVRNVRSELRAVASNQDPILPAQDPRPDTWGKAGYELEPGDSVRIAARKVWAHQIGRAAISEQSVALSGDPAYVVAVINRNSYTATPAIAVQDTEPTSDASFVRVLLYRFDLSNGAYVIGDTCRFDIHFDTPVR